MDLSEILQQLDALFHESRLTEAEAYLKNTIQTAKENQRSDVALSLLNELIGFYRDCGRNEEALATGKEALGLAAAMGLQDTEGYATTLVNVGNALRAAGNLAPAETFFAEANKTYEAILPKDHILFATLQNNLSLLYQEQEKWEEAKKALEYALDIVTKKYEATNEDQYLVKMAISDSNLAVTLLHLGEYETAREHLEAALLVFTGRTPSDFHYSAALACYGDYLSRVGRYREATGYYERALSEIELHMGRNGFFDIVTDNLKEAYRMCGTSMEAERDLSGLDLSRRYYEDIAKPVLQKTLNDDFREITVGLCGEGSECFEFDDAISRDHDFGPGFAIWVTDEVYERIGETLKSIYERLPKTFLGMRRIEQAEGVGRVGVMTERDFYKRLIGIDHVPNTLEEWLTVPMTGLAAAANGEIFLPNGAFARNRMRLLTGYPRIARDKHLAEALAKMAQSGQYNYNRMLQRGDVVAAGLYKSEFIRATLQAIHLLNDQFAPYDKWLYKSACRFANRSGVLEQIEALGKMPITETMLFEEISVWIRDVVLQKDLLEELTIPKEETYLAVYARALNEQADRQAQKEQKIERIVFLEWQAFDKVQNEGGRAGCQDDWDTFCIMRRSQYRTWPVELLASYEADFDAAVSRGWNLITEKYGRMMESTAPNRYEEIKDRMPVRAKEYLAIREAIISIQVGWMETLSEQYPLFSGNARAIHTYEDKLWRTSYETYLRGELTTYSEETLALYGRFVAELAKNGQNLAYMIMTETAKQYGYKDIAGAEAALRKEQNE